RTKPREPVIEFEEAADDELWERGPDGQPMGIAQSELWGEFNFRDTILDQLERYFIYLARMQKHDPSSYALYKEIGATILPPYSMPVLEDIKEQEKIPKPPRSLPIWFNEHRPTFGCFAYGIDPKVEQHELATSITIPKFMYFTKYSNPPPEFQPMSGGDTYKMTIWWDRAQARKHKLKWGIPEIYGVFIGNDGSVTVLRMLKTRMIPIKRKHKPDYFSIPQRAWRLPSCPPWVKKRGETAQNYLANLFIDAAETFEQSNYAVVRVSVKKDDLTAVFGVNVKRMGYFFQDPNITLTSRGGEK